MDPELAERLTRHGTWLDEHAAPLSFDAAVEPVAGNPPVTRIPTDDVDSTDPVAVVTAGGGPTDHVPRLGWPRRARWAVAAMAALAVVAGLAVVARQSGGAGIRGGADTSTPSTSGSLARALAALGVDEAQAPEVAEWASIRFCGTVTARTDGAVLQDDAIQRERELATRCFLDAVLTRSVVVVAQVYLDPSSLRPSAFDVYRSRADGRFDSLDRMNIDGKATLRRFTCAGIIANELLNAFPPPDYDPLFFMVHGCTDREPASSSDDPRVPPRWFVERETLPTCGTAPWHVAGSYLYPRRVSDGARACIAAAVQNGRAMEFGYGVPDASNGPDARWFRITGPGAYEAVEAKPDDTGRVAWQRSRCPTPLIRDDGTPEMSDLLAFGCTPIDPTATTPTTATEPPTPTSTAAAPTSSDPRATVAGLWTGSEPDAADATGPLPGGGGFRLSFIPDEGGPLVLQSSCGTYVAQDYDVTDGRLTIGPWIVTPAEECASITLDERTHRLQSLLAERPRFTLAADELSLGDGFDFQRGTTMPIDPLATAPTMAELRGRTFRALGGIALDQEEATVTFGDQVTVTTPCSETTIDATIVNGRLRTGAVRRKVTAGRTCNDSAPLATLAAWPRLGLQGPTLRFALDDFETTTFEVGPAPSSTQSTSRP